jgi:hypothetical protein
MNLGLRVSGHVDAVDLKDLEWQKLCWRCECFFVEQKVMFGG